MGGEHHSVQLVASEFVMLGDETEILGQLQITW